MNFITIIMAVFSVLGGLDRIFGNKLGLGKEFEKGFMLFGTMALSMIGMIIISPAIATALSPCFEFIYNTVGVDPSIIPASLFANDMGGASLAAEIAQNEKIGLFNALVVSSMMGCTISFTIPFALGCVKKEMHSSLLLGLLCGIVTIPVGCFVSGLLLKLPLKLLIINLLPIIIFALIIGAGLLFFPKVCIKIFGLLGNFMKIIITIGLVLGIIKFLTGFEIIKNLAPIEEGGAICLNATIVMTGAFPLMFTLSKLLRKPMSGLGKWLNINETSALGFISSLATNVTTFEMMNSMDKKGAVLNSAFAVSASFTFAGHLAFTLAFDGSYLPYVLAGKLISGFFALFFAVLIFKKNSSAVGE